MTASLKEKQTIFDYSGWTEPLKSLHHQYVSAHPFPHIVLDNFLNPGIAERVAREFDQINWQAYKHFNEDKEGGDTRTVPPLTERVLNELNSPEFLQFLTGLTGIENLIADEKFGSGGVHQSTRGGFLNIHADFTVHPYHRNWHRRINVLIYLNKGWQEDWGGKLELWSTDMKRCEQKVVPIINRCVVFNTATDSYHGHPEPMTCPPGVKRRSIAMYYYTLDENSPAISTEYKARPGDNRLKSSMIFMDKMALRIFHQLKSILKLNDSVVTGWMTRSKPKK